MTLIVGEKHKSKHAVETLAAALAHELNPRRDWSDCDDTLKSLYRQHAIVVHSYLQSHGVILARIGRPLSRCA